jgi:catechol 2,3-dioxygenase-like lactoylglutathione lyase family enzyme
MIHGGNTTIYVRDIGVSIDFYTKVLGLRLRMRAGDAWAEIDGGPGLLIGLHPCEPPHTPEPGTRGSLAIGLNVTQDLEIVVKALTKRGVHFDGPIVDDANVRLAFFGDPDGNALYLAQVLHAGAHGGPPA